MRKLVLVDSVSRERTAVVDASFDASRTVCVGTVGQPPEHLTQEPDDAIEVGKRAGAVRGVVGVGAKAQVLALPDDGRQRRLVAAPTGHREREHGGQQAERAGGSGLPGDRGDRELP
jgi:hypothetical protein